MFRQNSVTRYITKCGVPVNRHSLVLLQPSIIGGNSTDDYLPGPLRILTIATSGTENDATNITVRYAGSKEHTTEWIGLRANGGMWRTCESYLLTHLDCTNNQTLFYIRNGYFKTQTVYWHKHVNSLPKFLQPVSITFKYVGDLKGSPSPSSNRMVWCQTWTELHCNQRQNS